MAFSKFLDSKCQDCKALVAALRKHFTYVSVLGVDVKSTSIRLSQDTAAFNGYLGPDQAILTGMKIF